MDADEGGAVALVREGTRNKGEGAREQESKSARKLAGADGWFRGSVGT
jgi:hypothetical protein